jgi:hypothetical protein
MNHKYLAAFVLTGLSLFLFTTVLSAQGFKGFRGFGGKSGGPPGGGDNKGGFPGGGFGRPTGGGPPGGFPGGGFGRPTGGGDNKGGPPGGGNFGGGAPGGGMFGDPEKMFGMIARDKDYIVISETRLIKEPLTKWAQENGITDGKISKDQFITFSKTLEKKIESGEKPLQPKGPPGGPGGPKKDDGKKGDENQSPEEKAKKYGEYQFGRMDDNDDGMLNKDEMGRSDIRERMDKYDKDKNGLINKDEYIAYFMDRNADRIAEEAKRKNKDSGGTAIRILLEEELYKRPTMLRLGNLPSELDWFAKLDTYVKDGQVELYEWTSAGKDIQEFLKMDRNDDGYLTAEEALFYKNVVEKDSSAFAKFYQSGNLNNYPSFAPAEAEISGDSSPASGSSEAASKKTPYFTKKKGR